jgi:hypothetical protein
VWHAAGQKEGFFVTINNVACDWLLGCCQADLTDRDMFMTDEEIRSTNGLVAMA